MRMTEAICEGYGSCCGERPKEERVLDKFADHGSFLQGISPEPVDIGQFI